MESTRVVILSVLVSVLAFTGSQAAPTEIGVGIQLMNVDTIDLALGSFGADFVAVFFNYSSNSFIYYEPRLSNTRDSSATNLTNWPATRYYSVLSFTADAGRFPFDSQTLEIVFENEYRNNESEIFVPMLDYTLLDAGLRLRGWTWDLSSPSSSYNLTPSSHYYAIGNASAAGIVFSWRVTRSYVISIQMLIPPSLILISVFVSFSIPITQPVTRIGIVQSALVSETLLHTGLVRTTATGSIMLFDYFMIICYIIIICSIIENVVVMVLLRGDKTREVMGRWLESKAKFIIWLIAPFFFFFLFLEPWAAVLVIISPPVLFLLGRFIVQKIRRYRMEHKVTQKKENQSSEGSEDDENRDARVVDKGGAEMERDFRSTVIRNELKRGGSTQIVNSKKQQYAGSDTDESSDEA